MIAQFTLANPDTERSRLPRIRIRHRIRRKSQVPSNTPFAAQLRTELGSKTLPQGSQDMPRPKGPFC